ncbi:MAG: protein phosphatase 2C domain-containing protein [Pseudomonadota bacterium]
MSLIYCVGKTDPGLVRTNNEDTFAMDEQKGYCLVADGIGGAADGEIASELFAATVRDLAARLDTFREDTAADLVETTFKKGNTAIFNYALDDASRMGMGCTAELIVFCPTGFVLGHIGDSRTYRLRNKVLKQLTRDHSLRQEQLDLGLISRSELDSHAYKNLITRALGIEKHATLDILKGSTLPGDLFLQCSDGLTDMIADAAILEILTDSISEDTMADLLVRAALDAGGRDNITVVLARII